MIQISGQIPPVWTDYEIKVEGQVATLHEYAVPFPDGVIDGHVYSLRLKFANIVNNGTSNILCFVVPC